jgi:hypothetical protein
MKHSVFFLVVSVLIIIGCSKDNELNFFTLSQDIEFGAQLDSTIHANPKEYPWY